MLEMGTGRRTNKADGGQPRHHREMRDVALQVLCPHGLVSTSTDHTQQRCNHAAKEDRQSRASGAP